MVLIEIFGVLFHPSFDFLHVFEFKSRKEILGFELEESGLECNMDIFGILHFLNQRQNITVVLTDVISLGQKQVVFFSLRRLNPAVVQLDCLLVVTVL